MDRNARLELLLKAYVDMSLAWSKAGIGDNASRHWSSCRFLEALIKQECKGQGKMGEEQNVMNRKGAYGEYSK